MYRTAAATLSAFWQILKVARTQINLIISKTIITFTTPSKTHKRKPALSNLFNLTYVARILNWKCKRSWKTIKESGTSALSTKRLRVITLDRSRVMCYIACLVCCTGGKKQKNRLTASTPCTHFRNYIPQKIPLLTQSTSADPIPN